MNCMGFKIIINRGREYLGAVPEGLGRVRMPAWSGDGEELA